MSDWIQIGNEINEQAGGVPDDIAHANVRHKYLAELHKQTGRNVITYYSGWIQHPHLILDCLLDDTDTSAFMTLSREIPHDAGLDLFLHTPGGGIAAAQAIINFLRQIYGADIRAFVIQLAMSAGTMLACACKQILMGSQSSLGPVDPQIPSDTGVIPAHGIIREFNQAKKDIIDNPFSRFAWEPILSQYPPTRLDQCEQLIEWSKELVKESLLSSMFKINCDDDEATKVDKLEKVCAIVSALTLTNESMSGVHQQRLSRDKCKSLGLNVKDVFELDACNGEGYKPTVYAIHWSNIRTLESQPITKIIENHEGKSIIRRHV